MAIMRDTKKRMDMMETTMKIREILTKKDLPFDEERLLANKILTSVLARTGVQEQFDEAIEETAEVRSPIVTMQEHDGITSAYWFELKGYGIVEVYIGDSPEDCTVKWLDKAHISIVY